MNVLAIDQGTSATKALVVASDGAVLGMAEVPVHPRVVDGDGVEQDPDELWQSVVDGGTGGAGRGAGARRRRRAREPGRDGAGVGPRDRDVRCSPAISWQDRRARRVCERLAARRRGLAATTGLPLDPYFAAPKMRGCASTWARTGVVTTTDAWLLHRLTGAFVTDAATASRTRCSISTAARGRRRLARRSASTRRRCRRSSATPSPSARPTAFGAAFRSPGSPSISRRRSSRSAASRAGDAKCTYGTGAFLLANIGDEPRRSGAGLVACVAWRLGATTTYCLDGQVYTAGAAVPWLERRRAARATSPSSTRSRPRADDDGVVFVPALAGLARAVLEAGARAVRSSASASASERAHLARAVVEGIAAQVACSPPPSRPTSAARSRGSASTAA